MHVGNMKPVLGSRINYGHPLSVGLVGCWLMHEGGGYIVNDLSGNGNEGVKHYNLSWVAAKYGHGIYNNNAQVSVEAEALYTTDFTKVAVVRLDAISSGQRRNLMCSAGHWYFEFYSDTGWLRYYDYGLTPSGWHGVSGVVGTGEWYCVAAVYKNGNYLKLYVDGVEVYSDSPVTGTPRTTGFDMLGSYSSYNWDGIMDNALQYNRALSASEMAELYADPFCMFRRDPIELWTAASPGTVTPATNRTHIMGRNKCSYATKRCVARSFVNY